jgi:hypothetical protein
LGHWPIYCNQTWRKGIKQSVILNLLSLSLSLSLLVYSQAAGGDFPQGEGLECDYGLRSRGPALLGAEALDSYHQ